MTLYERQVMKYHGRNTVTIKGTTDEEICSSLTPDGDIHEDSKGKRFLYCPSDLTLLEANQAPEFFVPEIYEIIRVSGNSYVNDTSTIRRITGQEAIDLARKIIAVQILEWSSERFPKKTKEK